MEGVCLLPNPKPICMAREYTYKPHIPTRQTLYLRLKLPYLCIYGRMYRSCIKRGCRKYRSCIILSRILNREPLNIKNQGKDRKEVKKSNKSNVGSSTLHQVPHSLVIYSITGRLWVEWSAIGRRRVRATVEVGRVRVCVYVWRFVIGEIPYSSALEGMFLVDGRLDGRGKSWEAAPQRRRCWSPEGRGGGRGVDPLHDEVWEEGECRGQP
jgi:hypothetical protein